MIRPYAYPPLVSVGSSSTSGVNMTKFSVVAISMLIFWMTAGAAAAGPAEFSYIEISNPFLRKIPIAIPLFKSTTQSPQEIQTARECADMLSESLEFTGYFKILDRAAFLEDPQKTGIVASAIKYRNWTAVGAELLVTGGIFVKDDFMEIELRLLDTFKEKLIYGRKYKASLKAQRQIILRFCDEVIFMLTGNRGIFESKIAFVSTGTGNKEIYICDFDGHNPQQYTHDKSISLFPAWSSDGQWMAYTSYSRGKPDIFIHHLHERRGVIVNKKGLGIAPSWMPGKFQLAATLSYSGDQEIYLLTGDGKIIKRLTNSRGIDVEPNWSPDGKRFAFTSKRSGTPQIYIKEIDTNRVERLTYEGRYNTQPCWSPKGDRIAYSGMNNGQNQIFTIDLDRKSPVQLTTDDQGDSEAPSWSPDGSLIVFSTTREGPSRIYVMTAYGTDQRRLLALPGEQTTPRWSPSGLSN